MAEQSEAANADTATAAGADASAEAGTGTNACNIRSGYLVSLYLAFALKALLGELLLPCVRLVRAAAELSSSSKVTASARLLLVLVARSLVVLHDALEAAAAAAAGVTPAEFTTRAAPGDAGQDEQQDASTHGVNDSRHDSSSAEAARHWKCYQSNLAAVGAQLLSAVQRATRQQSAAAAAAGQPGQEQQAHQAAAVWPHRLQLHAAPKLVAAAEQLQERWAESYAEMVVQHSSSSRGAANPGHVASMDPAEQQQDTQEQQASKRLEGLVADVLSFCRRVAAAVPLPEVCNNPSCECLEGVSEAAAAVKACSGCGARYCSVQCQQAHYRVHKKACRRLRLQFGSTSAG
jgi:hypothetical protein